LTKIKNFVIIIVENEKRIKKMNELIIFLIILCIMGLVSIVTIIDEYRDTLYFKRRCARERFLANHPNYAEDAEGNLYKIK